MASAAARPLVTVQTLSSDMKTDQPTTVPLPHVMKASIRPDIVNFVHSNISKNSRQPYAVSRKAGYQTSAESWGTGRAVSRIPRVPGGGTHRAGQGAFGNMCRGGGMFAPTRIWRRWHRKINVNQRRYAVVSAIAASAVPSLVMARGHKVETVPELPLVVSDSVEGVEKTVNAIKVLKEIGAYPDAEKAKDSVGIRPGVGKMRNRRYIARKGPLIVYGTEGAKLVKAFRNIPGVEVANVERLNLLKLAPGGHLGRFIIWTSLLSRSCESIYGSFEEKSEKKSGYVLPRAKMVNADLARIINSDEVQSVVRPIKTEKKRACMKKNPLKNLNTMLRKPRSEEAAHLKVLLETGLKSFYIVDTSIDQIRIRKHQRLRPASKARFLKPSLIEVDTKYVLFHRSARHKFLSVFCCCWSRLAASFVNDELLIKDMTYLPILVQYFFHAAFDGTHML
ncbi:60S ribosomal protein L4 [Tanacetum coccineum]|uniref:60S ribosomal protein L4 n=1 Tax=Tanacetum coccineum TaxID=301880 RepID=A0ABQ4Y8S5_9ASTR